MSQQVADKRFGCDGCGKSYPWKPELTNKKAKCKCGAILTVPDLSEPEPAADDPPALPDEGIFDFIDNAPEVASTRAESLRAAAMPVAQPVAAPKKKAPVLGYRSGPTQRERKREAELANSIHSMVRDIYVPIGLIVGSFVAYFTFLYFSGSATSGASILVYGLTMALLFAVKTVFMIGGAFIVASLAGVSFGPFSTAILKLAAVAVAPDIVGEMIDATGIPMLGWGVSLLLYWTLVAQLFGMGADEAWMVVVLFGVLRWIMNFVIAMFIISLLFSGGGGALGSAASSIGGGSTSTLSATSEAQEFDEKVAEWKENDLLVEGLDYIAQKGRQSGMTDTIKALYAAGARNVWFAVSRDINGKLEPEELVAEWPRDEKKRAAMNKAIADRMKARAKADEAEHPDWGPIKPIVIKDEGGKYVAIPLGG
jgi:hypothetical protein